MNPSTPYATSKAAADMLLANFMAHKTLPLLTVRATKVYGARQQVFKIMMRAAIYIRLGRRIPLHGGGKAIKSYIHIRDVSRGELAVLEASVGYINSAVKRLEKFIELNPNKKDVLQIIDLKEKLGRSLN